jgi:hypothetical protein
MKKSEALKMAMIAVLADGDIDYEDTIQIMEVLIEERRSALWSEEREEAKQNGESV